MVHKYIDTFSMNRSISKCIKFISIYIKNTGEKDQSFIGDFIVKHMAWGAT